MVKILHFADAHLDMANFGRQDPISGLPYRVMDFLKSLDTIVDAAIEEKVEMVVFAGDAFKDRVISQECVDQISIQRDLAQRGLIVADTRHTQCFGHGDTMARAKSDHTFVGFIQGFYGLGSSAA